MKDVYLNPERGKNKAAQILTLGDNYLEKRRNVANSSYTPINRCCCLDAYPVCQPDPKHSLFGINYFSGLKTGHTLMPKSPLERPDTQVTPAPALEKRNRRQFKPEYKLRMLAEADACQHGELGALGALLRREKLYASQLSDWRREFAANGVAGLTKSAPGPAPLKTPEQRRIEQLEKENSRLICRTIAIATVSIDLFILSINRNFAEIIKRESFMKCRLKSLFEG